MVFDKSVYVSSPKNREKSNPRKINPFKVLIGILPGPNPGISEEESSTRKYSEKKKLTRNQPGEDLEASGWLIQGVL